MHLEKSSFGYNLITSNGAKQNLNTDDAEISKSRLDYISGLMKRLRNLFLSVLPVDYCCIMLYGADDQSDPCESGSDQQIETKHLEYMGQAIGLLRYKALDNIKEDDRAKIDMLADLYGYLIYHHLMMFEVTNID